MDTETRAAIAAMGDTILARMDHHFELNQAQYLELRGDISEIRGDISEIRGDIAELRTDVRELRDRVDSLTDRVSRLENAVLLLRDYVTREVAGIRSELRELRDRPGQTDELRREIAELTVRVDRLERRQPD